MVEIGRDLLSLEDFSEILAHKDRVTLRKEELEKVDASFRFLKEFSSNKLIYGLNTGLGGNVDRGSTIGSFKD